MSDYELLNALISEYQRELNLRKSAKQVTTKIKISQNFFGKSDDFSLLVGGKVIPEIKSKENRI